MHAVIDWLREMFIAPSPTQTIIILSVVSGLGLQLAKLRIGNLSLGVTFVFFVGIVFSHFGVETDAYLLRFMQSFGLALFVYALGVQVGPSFFPSLRAQGVVYNAFGILLILLTYALMIGLMGLWPISMPNLLGVMSGAVTNTPVLAAVQSTLQEAHPADTQVIREAAMATAITYPMGVVGVILVMTFLTRLKSPKGKQGDEKEEWRAAFVVEYEVRTPELCGHTVRELVGMTSKHFIISRLWRGHELILPTSNTVIHEGDHLLLLCHEEDAEELATFFGMRADSRDWNKGEINWDAIDAGLNSKRIIITNPKVNGVKLATLKLRNRYGINITRIDRVGIELLPSPELYLQTGDRLTIVGEAGALSQVEKLLGNSIELLDKPRLISFFFGLALGCLVGSIPFFLPGLSSPIRLGLAGGPVLVGILIGAFGSRLHLSTYMTNSATQLIKQIGLVLYLAGLGLLSGKGLLETFTGGAGVQWLVMGTLITIVPTLIVGVLAIKVFGRKYTEVAGMLCGTMANPFALDYVSEQTQSRIPSVAYATVYPVGIFLRIITAQLILMFYL